MHLLQRKISKIIFTINERVFTDRQRKIISEKMPKWLKIVLKKIFLNNKMYAKKLKVNQIKKHLYNYGFIKKSLDDLERLCMSDDEVLANMAKWELALWYANDYSKLGAEKALNYLKELLDKEKDVKQRRKYVVLIAESLQILNEVDQAKELIKSEIEKNKHPDLCLGMANLDERIEEKLNWINKVYEYYDLSPIYFNSDQSKPSYNDLDTQKQNNKSIIDGPKVSIIIPAYNAAEGIEVAIKSIQNQTWQNIEVIIVDDHSKDNTLDIIKEYQKSDSRIKVFQTPHNSGPYVARNIGLQESTGEFITINDADDWSHAEKIEKQVKHLINNPQIIANTSEHARLTEELSFYRRGNPGKYIFPNMSSIMFRKKPVIEKLGYWDSVRFAADGEFKRRLIKEFGNSKYVDLKSGPLSLPRQSVSSLTSSPAFGYNGFFMGARKEYVSSLEHYHHEAKSLYYPYPQKERPFPTPEPMWPKREMKIEGYRQFDVLICSDFRLEDEENFRFLLKQFLNSDEKVGLIQMYVYDTNIEKDDFSIRNLINKQNIPIIVYGEKVKSKKVIILNDAVLYENQKYIPVIEADTLYLKYNGQLINKQAESIKRYFNKDAKSILNLEELISNQGDSSK